MSIRPMTLAAVAPAVNSSRSGTQVRTRTAGTTTRRACGALRQPERGGRQVDRGGQAHVDPAVVERERSEGDGSVRRGGRQEGEAEAESGGGRRLGDGGHRFSFDFNTQPKR